MKLYIFLSHFRVEQKEYFAFVFFIVVTCLPPTIYSIFTYLCRMQSRCTKIPKHQNTIVFHKKSNKESKCLFNKIGIKNSTIK